MFIITLAIFSHILNEAIYIVKFIRKFNICACYFYISKILNIYLNCIFYMYILKFFKYKNSKSVLNIRM